MYVNSEKAIKTESSREKSRWLKITKMVINHKTSGSQCEVKLDHIEFNKKDLDNLNISLNDVSGVVSDTMDKVYSYFMATERVKDAKSLKKCAMDLILKVQDTFEKNFKIKLSVDNDRLWID